MLVIYFAVHNQNAGGTAGFHIINIRVHGSNHINAAYFFGSGCLVAHGLHA